MDAALVTFVSMQRLFGDADTAWGIFGLRAKIYSRLDRSAAGAAVGRVCFHIAVKPGEHGAEVFSATATITPLAARKTLLLATVRAVVFASVLWAPARFVRSVQRRRDGITD